MTRRSKDKNGKFDLGALDALPHPPPSELRARELDDEQLAKIDHAGWLEDFARITLLPSPVPMTPRRLGTATRLQWAARYIKLLQDTLVKQATGAIPVEDVTRPGNPDPQMRCTHCGFIVDLTYEAEFPPKAKEPDQ